MLLLEQVDGCVMFELQSFGGVASPTPYVSVAPLGTCDIIHLPNTGFATITLA
jgi:hypothetical protein